MITGRTLQRAFEIACSSIPALVDQLLDIGQHHQPVQHGDARQAMKPTAAEIENGMPRSHSASTPPVSASGTALNTRAASRADPERTHQQQKDQHEAERHDDREPLRARPARFSNWPPHSSSIPAGSFTCASILGARVACDEADVAIPDIGGHDHAPLAVLAADLVQPFAEVELMPAARAEPSRAFRPSAAGDTGRFFQRIDVVRAIAAGNRTTISKRRSPSNTSPASRPPIAVPITSCRHGSARAARSRPCRLDIQHRQAAGLLDLHVHGAGIGRAQHTPRLAGPARILLESSPKLDGEIAAHAGDQLVEAHLDRLGELILHCPAIARPRPRSA
jgi:hypothetical protein